MTNKVSSKFANVMPTAIFGNLKPNQYFFMKKIFLFLAAGVISLSSCSSDSDGGSSARVTMTLDGVNKTYGSAERTTMDAGDGMTHVSYTLVNVDDPNETIIIEAYQNADDEGITDFMLYRGNNFDYMGGTPDFPWYSSITAHTDHKFNATFSGKLYPSGVTIANGKINLKY